MNNITILGRIGRDPEMRTTAGGMQVLSFPVADSKKIKGEEKTTWYECSIFGKRAESLQNYIRKGEQITVSGTHELQTWQKDDGSTGFKCAVMVSDVGLINGQSDNANQGQQSYQQPQGNVTAAIQQRPVQQPQQSPQQFGQTTGQPAPAPLPPEGSFDDFDDDIPF